MTYTIKNLPVALQQAFAERQVYTPSGDAIKLDSNVSSEEAVNLYSVVRHLRPMTSAEVGFAKGVSTAAILQAVLDGEQGHHHVIDPFQKNYAYAGVELVRRSNLSSLLTFHETFAENVIPNLTNIQFAFIDSSHLFDLTLAEFVLIDKKLDIGGVIGFHDLWMPSLQKTLRYILNNRAYQIYAYPSALQKPTQKLKLKARVKRRCLTLLRNVPKSEKCFSPEIVRPWSSFSLPNLVFIEKLGSDQREWQFHETF